jgi:hypothetical protein
MKLTLFTMFASQNSRVTVCNSTNAVHKPQTVASLSVEAGHACTVLVSGGDVRCLAFSQLHNLRYEEERRYKAFDN